MVSSIEFQGRLGRPEGRHATPGNYDLVFRLHSALDAEESVWEEAHTGVAVGNGGVYRVVLGQQQGLEGRFFESGPCYLSVMVAGAGQEGAERVLIVGNELKLDQDIRKLEDQLALVLLATRKRLKKLARRMQSLEAGEGPIRGLGLRLEVLEARLNALDGEEGRMVQIEDELEDIVGPDGDLIDIYERLERLEGTPGPALRRSTDDNPRIAELFKRLGAVENKTEGKSSVDLETITPDSIQAVRKSGDTMTGGLIIQKGGLHVASGGIHCRGAEVNSLEASLQVKTPKVVTEALELKGDITVDNTQRSLQIRHIEGRAGGGKKDGALHLNTRSGAEVVIGKAEEGEGLKVHGPVRVDGVEAEGLRVTHTGFATVFPASELLPGEVACLNEKGQLIRPENPGDSRVIGIVALVPALAAGPNPKEGNPTFVVTAGVTRCKVTGPIKPGDRLVAAAKPGYACRSENPVPGTVLGKALAASSAESGEILIVVR
jgi:hypothetical protein